MTSHSAVCTHALVAATPASGLRVANSATPRIHSVTVRRVGPVNERLRLLRIPFILLLNLLGLVRYAVAATLAAIGRLLRGKKRRYVKLEFEGSLPFGHPHGLGRIVKSDATFLDLRRDIKTLAGDSEVRGVVLEPGKSRLGAARNADLFEELDQLRESGKHVVAHASLYHTGDYLEACSADAILLPPAGRLYSFAPRFEQFFLAEAFERHGIAAQFVHIGAYKAAASRYVRDSLTAPQTRMMSDLRDGIVDLLLARVAARRGLTRTEAERLFDAPLDSRKAIAAGLLDGEVFDDDLERWLEGPDDHAHHLEDAAAAPAVEVMSLSDYKAARAKPYTWRPLVRPRKRIALVDLTGIIVQDGMSIPGATSVIDPKQVLPLLRSLETNRSIAAVLLHINSPGGSALSSDLIWNAVSHLRAKKPVVAYCSDVAASGGYYIAVAADRIVCRAETITGSIGVVAGKFAVREALERVGVTVQSIDGGDDGSEFGSIFAPLEPRTIENLKSDARSFYRRFLQRVGQSRHIEKRRLHRYGRGRVYLGEEALHRNLVDDLGGFSAAIRAVRDLCIADGIELPTEPELAFFTHETRGLKDILRRSAFEATGTTNFLEPLAIAKMMRDEPLLALLPWRPDLS